MIKYFHELTQNEYDDLRCRSVRWSKIVELYPKPDWCKDENALKDDVCKQCWMLVGLFVKSKDSCAYCKYYKK